MDCQAARLLLWFKRPQSSDLLAEDETALAQHLAGCSACSRLARLTAQENRLLGRAIRAVPVPSTLKERLLSHLDTQRIKLWRVERGRWLRRAGLTLLTLLVLCLGVLYWTLRPVGPASLRELDWWSKARFSLPTQVPGPDKIGWLDQYFYSKQVPFRVTTSMRLQWDFTHLTAAYLEEFSRDHVPVMEFKKPGGHAFVFVLPAARCDFGEIEHYQSAGETRLLCPPEEGFVTFVALKEGTLDQFLLSSEAKR